MDSLSWARAYYPKNKTPAQLQNSLPLISISLNNDSVPCFLTRHQKVRVNNGGLVLAVAPKVPFKMYYFLLFS